MNTSLKTRRRWLREPLLHFIVFGALLFLLFFWRGGVGPGSSRIVITPGQIDSIVAGFARTWQRPPTAQELKGLLDEHLRDEIAVREAMAAGLDRDDSIIRRRLRQKFEFLAEDSFAATPPTDTELQAWMEAHPESFRREPRLAFRQVYLNPDRRKTALEADARKLLAQLSKAGPDAKIDTLGDALMLPQETERATHNDTARLFGEGFADSLLKVEPGRWTGPIRSGYGLHLVLVRERDDGGMPALADVRPLVEREFTAERRRRELAAMYARLLERYRVVIEKGADDLRARGAVSPQGAGASN